MDPEEFKKKMEQMKKEESNENSIKPETTGGVIADSKNVFDLDKLDVKENLEKNKNIPVPPKLSSPEIHTSGLRTLTTDISDAARNEELSVIKIALAEQRKKEIIEDYNSPKSKRNIFYIICSILFIFLSLFIAYFLITKNKAVVETVTPVVYNKGDNLIAFDTNKIIRVTNLSKSSTLKTIKENLNFEIKNNLVTNYSFVDDTLSPGKILSASDFLKKIESHMPITLASSLDTQFVLGTVGQTNTESKNVPFLIIKGTDNQSVALGMQNWEKTMLDDFYLMYEIDLSGTNSALLGQTFQNTTILNKDTRILVDSGGKTVMLYLFLDDKTILITTTGDIVKEIINRFYNAIAN